MKSLMESLSDEKFQLSDLNEAGGGFLSTILFVGERHAIRIEGDVVDGQPVVAVSVENLTDPSSGEVHTDVFGGNFATV